MNQSDILKAEIPNWAIYARTQRAWKPSTKRPNSKKKGDTDAIKLVEFRKVKKNARKIKDPNTKDAILAYIGAMLNIQQLAKDMKGQATTELVSNGVDMIPVISSGKMIRIRHRKDRPEKNWKAAVALSTAAGPQYRSPLMW